MAIQDGENASTFPHQTVAGIERPLDQQPEGTGDHVAGRRSLRIQNLTMFHYFGYGSNINLISLKAKGVEPTSSEWGMIPGWRLRFNVQHWFRHEGGVGNNNYIDLNVWDNSLAATTLGTYNAARFHIYYTQFPGNRYVINK